MATIENRKQLSKRHSKTLKRVYRVIDNLIEELEEFQRCKEVTEEQLARWSRSFGEKETIASMAIKLTATLSKIIPMENDVMEVIENMKEKKIQDISKDEIEILKRYLKKVKKRGQIEIEGEDADGEEEKEDGS